MSDINVKGLSELNKFLQELPVKVEKNILRGALRAGANVIKDEAKANVPVKSGDLRNSLKISVRYFKGRVTASIKTAMWYAHIIEFTGAVAHWIRVNEDAKPSRITRRGPKTYSVQTLNKMAKRGSLRIGGSFVGSSVEHPGMKAKPFLRPALDSQALNATVASAEYIKKRLESKHGIDTADIGIGGES